jgi:hypothetical protein
MKSGDLAQIYHMVSASVVRMIVERSPIPEPF